MHLNFDVCHPLSEIYYLWLLLKLGGKRGDAGELLWEDKNTVDLYKLLEL
jgi:hypothetical protein